MTTIWEAALAGEVPALKVLLRRGCSVNAENPELDSPLHLAVEGRQPEAVKLLLNNGALVNAINGRRQTPLQLAVATGHAGIVSMLLAAGADATALRDIDADTGVNSKVPAAVAECLRTARVPTPCPLHCGAVMQGRLLDHHVHEDCPRRRVPCPRCAAEMAAGDIPQHLDRHCLLTTVPCPLGCGALCIGGERRGQQARQCSSGGALGGRSR